jgi:hypothetical protein
MSAAVLSAKQTQSCPAWCHHEADDDDGLHLSEVSEVGEVLLHLSQDSGDQAPKIGMTQGFDQELYFTVDEAQRIGTILLELAQAARTQAARTPAARHAA